MRWNELIAATVKLIDLHDSNRDIGSGIVPPPETRPGREDAIWLSIAIELLEFLHVETQETNESWIFIGSLIKELAQKYSVSEDDIIYVVIYLSTPSKINFSNFSNTGQLTKTSTKKTALIDRPRNKSIDRCRLTEIGHSALKISKITQSFLYAKHDAEKLHTAILTGDYSTIETQGRLILQTIRALSQQITKFSEGSLDDALESFLTDKLQEFKDAIAGVSGAVDATLDLFSSQSEREKFEAWYELQESPTVNASSINALFKNILTNSYKLREKVSQFLDSFIDENREAYGIVRFDQVALDVLKEPVRNSDIEWNFLKMVPWSVEAYCSSIYDFQCVVAAKTQAQVESLSFEHSSQHTSSASISRFIDSHFEEIKAILETDDLSLSKAIEMGWIELDGEESIPDLLGLYTTPAWLEKEGLKVGIMLSSKPSSLLANVDGKKFYGKELILTKYDGEQ